MFPVLQSPHLVFGAGSLAGIEAELSLFSARRPLLVSDRATLMSGVANHKGLGPVHAIALSCGDQGLHHGVLVAAALPSALHS